MSNNHKPPPPRLDKNILMLSHLNPEKVNPVWNPSTPEVSAGSRSTPELLWTVKLYAFRALYSLTENKMALMLYNLKA